MIITGRGLVSLTAAASATTLQNARIGFQNHARSDTVTGNNVTVSSEIDGAPRDAPLRPDTAEYWQAAALPATWTVDLGRFCNIDYVGIAAHSFGSDRCSVLVETSPDGVTYTEFADDVMPADDAPIMILGDLLSARFVRITLEGLGDVARMGVVYIGEALAMQRAVAGSYRPITMSRETVTYQGLSRGGQFLGQSFRRNGVKGSAAFKYLDADWVRANFDDFSKAARQYPYFFAWNPQDFPDEIGYVWTAQDIVPMYMGLIDQMEVSWEMKGIGLGA